MQNLKPTSILHGASGDNNVRSEFRLRFISIVVRRPKITENEKKTLFTTSKPKSNKVKYNQTQQTQCNRAVEWNAGQ